MSIPQTKQCQILFIFELLDMTFDTRINTVLAKQRRFHLHILFNNLLYIQDNVGKYPSITSFDLRKIALDLVNV